VAKAIGNMIMKALSAQDKTQIIYPQAHTDELKVPQMKKTQSAI